MIIKIKPYVNIFFILFFLLPWKYIYIIKLFKYYGYLVKFKTYYLIFILLRLFNKISLKFIINHQIDKRGQVTMKVIE